MHLNVVTTLRCNLRCAHCIYACPAPGDLDPGDYTRTLEALIPHGLRSLILTGGEPCLHPEFDRLVDEAAERGLLFEIASNAWDFRAYDGAVRRHRRLFAGFRFSLDGLEATHDRARGAGSFARVVNALEECREAGVPARATLVLTDFNRAELQGVVAACAAAGVLGVKLGGLIPVPRAPGVRLSAEARLSAAEEAPALALAHGIHVEIASSLLTPPTVEFCPVMTTSALTLNEKGEITWCCDVPGSASALGARGASAEDVLARRTRTKHEMVLDRVMKLRNGGPTLEDRTCAYCHEFFGLHAAARLRSGGPDEP